MSSFVLTGQLTPAAISVSAANSMCSMHPEKRRAPPRGSALAATAETVLEASDVQHLLGGLVNVADDALQWYGTVSIGACGVRLG